MTPDESAERFVADLESTMDGSLPGTGYDILRRALLERMRVNVGLVAECTELRRRLAERPAPPMTDDARIDAILELVRMIESRDCGCAYGAYD